MGSTAETAEAVASEMSVNHSDRRRRAEKTLQKEHGAMDDIASVDMQNLVHELRVHQIELEMQNNELRHPAGT